MIDLSLIYRNKRIPKGYYFAKVTDIATEELGQNRPRIYVALKIGPMHEEGGTILHSIIHATDASIYFYKNFVFTFLIRGNRFHEAIGKWGCIEVCNAKYDETRYSTVKYIWQPWRVRTQTHQIAQEEQQGLLDWGEEEVKKEPKKERPPRKTARGRRGVEGVPLIEFE